MLVPSSGIAQGSRYAVLSVSTTQTYEDNVFAASRAGDQVRDVTARVGPSLEAGYVSAPLTLVARYRFDAERSYEHPAFSRRLARQDVAIELRQRPTRRLALDVTAAYLESQTPYEFNLDTGLVAGRARAERLGAASAAAYEWSRVTRVNAEYGFTKGALEGGLRTESHDARLGLERHDAERNRRRLDYRFRQFSFGDDWTEASHVLSAGWSRNMTRRTSVELSLGPRLSAGRIRPELAAAVHRLLESGALSASYSRTQATAIGDVGTIDVQRVAASFLYQPERRVTLSASPQFVISARGGAHVSVYAIDMEASGRTRRGLSVVLSARVGRQRGTLAGRRDEIPYRRLSLGLGATFPRTEWARRAGASR